MEEIKILNAKLKEKREENHIYIYSGCCYDNSSWEYISNKKN